MSNPFDNLPRNEDGTINWGNKKVGIALHSFFGLLLITIAIFLANPSVIFSGNIVSVDGMTTSCNSEYKNGKKKSEQSEFTYQFNGQTYRGKSVKNSLHHCQKGSQIQLLINGNAPEKYLVTSNLVTVFILIAAGLVFLLVFVPMVYRHDPKNANDMWNMMIKKVESLYKNRGV